MCFLVRPAIVDDEPDVRKFFAYKDNRLIGYNYFDPIYRGREIMAISTTPIEALAILVTVLLTASI